MVDEDPCGVPMKDGAPCNQFLKPHCPGPHCNWSKCNNGHVVRPDGHVMGQDTWMDS